MPANPFDRFDERKPANPFDRFDAKKKGPDPYALEGLTAGAETVANVASAGVGGLVGGLAYLGGLAADATQGRYDPRGAPMAAMQATQNALTYQPRSELGQEVSGNVNNVLSLPARGGAALGTNVARVTNSPADRKSVV